MNAKVHFCLIQQPVTYLSISKQQHVGVDFVGVDFVGIDLMGRYQNTPPATIQQHSLLVSQARPNQPQR